MYSFQKHSKSSGVSRVHSGCLYFKNRLTIACSVTIHVLPVIPVTEIAVLLCKPKVMALLTVDTRAGRRTSVLATRKV